MTKYVYELGGFKATITTESEAESLEQVKALYPEANKYELWGIIRC